MTVSIPSTTTPLHFVRPSISLLQSGICPSRCPHQLLTRSWPIDPRRRRSPSRRHLSSTATCPSTDAPTPTHKYRVAAAYCGKDTRFVPFRDGYTYAECGTPVRYSRSYDKHQRRQNTGQDAFFIKAVAQSPHLALGVADGVGGWMDAGVDPALFSRALCRYMAQGAITFPAWSPKTKLEPVDLLNHGYECVFRDQSIEAGGSTACVAIADPHGHVAVAKYVPRQASTTYHQSADIKISLGDSGFLHLRGDSLLHVSGPQTHTFNTPYQLSVFPPVNGKRPRSMQEHLVDRPKDAVCSVVEMAPQDVMVFATDGLWDNLTPEEIVSVCTDVTKKGRTWQRSGWPARPPIGLPPCVFPAEAERHLQASLAAAIVAEAKAASMDERRASPFSSEMSKFYARDYTGGKSDDICVVVLIARKDESKPPVKRR